eukprot:scaffold256356_cov17-Tisochrysis_lutea.AAC.1
MLTPLLLLPAALHVRIPCATCSVKEEVMGLTPLHVASEAGQLEIVEVQTGPMICRPLLCISCS